VRNFNPPKVGKINPPLTGVLGGHFKGQLLKMMLLFFMASEEMEKKCLLPIIKELKIDGTFSLL